MTSVELLTEAYLPVVELAEQVDEEQGWLPSRLPGWTIRDSMDCSARQRRRNGITSGTSGSVPVGYP